MSELHFEIETPAGLMRGMSHSPSLPNGKPPVVVVHGYFSANRVGPARLYLLIARALAQAGFTVYRADFVGVGDSDGHFEDVTLDSHLRDLRCLIDFVLQANSTNSLTLIGHSFGANLGMLFAQSMTAVSRLVLLAPEVVFRGGIDRLFDQSQLDELRQTGRTTRKGLPVNSSFVVSLREQQLLRTTFRAFDRVTIVQGTSDELYDMSGAQLLQQHLPSSQLVTVLDADHNFLEPEPRNRLIDVILDDLLAQ